MRGLPQPNGCGGGSVLSAPFPVTSSGFAFLVAEDVSSNGINHRRSCVRVWRRS
jgi:hypothetical protein